MELPGSLTKTRVFGRRYGIAGFAHKTRVFRETEWKGMVVVAHKTRGFLGGLFVIAHLFYTYGLTRQDLSYI